jgi:hypothetical protein
MNKVIEDGQVAVLVSCSYGAGWSTWNRDYPELLFDPVMVKMVRDAGASERSGRSHAWTNFKADAEKYLLDKYGDDYICTQGLDGLHIVWVKEGTQFFIEEYDGSENLCTINSINWITA